MIAEQRKLFFLLFFSELCDALILRYAVACLYGSVACPCYRTPQSLSQPLTELAFHQTVMSSNFVACCTGKDEMKTDSTNRDAL